MSIISFVHRYSVTIGPDGRPEIREFDNIKTEARLGRPCINDQGGNMLITDMNQK
jgi:glutaredoxin-related protein